MAKAKIPHEKTEANPKGAGSPEIIIDWEQVDSLCKIQCTGEEIASVLDVGYNTIERACKRDHNVKFGDYIAQKKLGGKASLRRNQWKLAQDGNATMLVWLGKNMLNQTDKTETEISGGLTIDKIERTIVKAKD